MSLDGGRLKRWARACKKRDGNQCAMCGCKKLSKRIQVHHIYPKAIFPERAYELRNGICLCAGCHYAVVHAENSFDDGGNWMSFVSMFNRLNRLVARRHFNQENQDSI